MSEALHPRRAEPERHYSPDLPRFWITLPESITRRALDDSVLGALFPSHVGYFPHAKGHGIDRVKGLESTIFNYCTRGRGWCVIGDTHHEIGPGDLMVVPAGAAHAYASRAGDPWTLHWFHAMGRNIPRLLQHMDVSAASPVVHVGCIPELEALFVEVREALESDYTEQQLLDAALTLHHLLGMILRLRRQSRTHKTGTERVLATLDYMKRHLGAVHDVRKLCSLADLSPSRYSELVRAYTGCAPKEYLTRLRMHRAAQLLRTTHLPIAAIARTVGFADPLHFSRVFRRINQCSPRQYRVDRIQTDR